MPSRRAVAFSVRPSSRIRERTTSASSSTVSVRGGAFAARSRRLCSARLAACSMTTAIVTLPCSRHRARRLKPSKTSKRSPTAATRIGRSVSGSNAAHVEPGRSAAYDVEIRSIAMRAGSEVSVATAARVAGELAFWPVARGGDIFLPFESEVHVPRARVAEIERQEDCDQNGVPLACRERGRYSTTRSRGRPRHRSCSTRTSNSAPTRSPGSIAAPAIGSRLAAR